MSRRLSAREASAKIAAWLDASTSEDEVAADVEPSDDEQNEVIESDQSDASDSEPAAVDVSDDTGTDDGGDDLDDGDSIPSVETSNRVDKAASWTSKNGFVWSAAEPVPSKTRACNIRHTKEGPQDQARLVQTETDTFRCFIDDDILRMVIENTNRYGQMYMASKGRDPSEWKPIDNIEMNAVIGILYLLGVYRSQHESLRSLWSSGHSGRPVFRAAFGINRFEQILAFLRFDDRKTRQNRKANDKFALFRGVWNVFIANCIRNYVVSGYVTIDEQLIPFRGRCSFRQYMPNKPDKYSLKLFLMCDVSTAYTFNGLPYVGRKGNERCVGLAEHVVKHLVEPVHKSGINVTTDNWFTNSKFASHLFCQQITLLGTVCKNKQEVPHEFVAAKGKAVGSSLFGFCQKQTLLSYVPKKNKAVVLLSTMHDKKEFDHGSGKPVMITDYNKTKGAVDRVDQLCHNYSVQRRTKRWPLAYFYDCLNIAGINGQVVFMAKFPNWEIKHPHRRRIFLENLGFQLIRPWLERRAQVPRLPRATQTAIKICGVEKQKPVEVDEPIKKRRRCHICPLSLDNKTVDRCSGCKEPCCKDHKTVTVVCDYCID